MNNSAIYSEDKASFAARLRLIVSKNISSYNSNSPEEVIIYDSLAENNIIELIRENSGSTITKVLYVEVLDTLN